MEYHSSKPSEGQKTTKMGQTYSSNEYDENLNEIQKIPVTRFHNTYKTVNLVPIKSLNYPETLTRTAGNPVMKIRKIRVFITVIAKNRQ